MTVPFENSQLRKESRGKNASMKIPTDTVILPILACASILACSHWNNMADPEALWQQSVSRRDLALRNQKILDDMKGTIRDMRAKASQGSPAHRVALERELIPIEKMLQQTQLQLLLTHADDEATRRLIRQSFQLAPLPESTRWNNGG